MTSLLKTNTLSSVTNEISVSTFEDTRNRKIIMKKLSALIVAVSLLSGCSTGYQKMDHSCGYSDMKLSSNTYLVEYTSNAYTGHSTNIKHALRRAAELTKANGYKYFKVANSTDTSSRYTQPVTATTTTMADVFGRSTYGTSSTVVTGGNTYTKPGVALVITMLKNKTADAYDAAIILSNFKTDNKK